MTRAEKWTKLDTTWKGVSVYTTAYGYQNHDDPWLEQRYQGD